MNDILEIKLNGPGFRDAEAIALAHVEDALTDGYRLKDDATKADAVREAMTTIFQDRV